MTGPDPNSGDERYWARLNRNTADESTAPRIRGMQGCQSWRGSCPLCLPRFLRPWRYGSGDLGDNARYHGAGAQEVGTRTCARPIRNQGPFGEGAQRWMKVVRTSGDSLMSCFDGFGQGSEAVAGGGGGNGAMAPPNAQKGGQHIFWPPPQTPGGPF